MKKTIFALSLFILGWTAPLSAEVMTYQGRLKESNVPVNANRIFLFEFCATETPTGCVASADGAKPFAVQNGLFKSTFTLPAVDLSAGPWYLRVNVEGSYLSPVEKLTFVPYSLYASTAAYSPAALQKAGDTMTGQLTLSGSTLTVTGSSFSVGGSTLVVVNGNVGIGTTNPQAKLDVDGGHAIFENDGSDINLYLKTKTAGAYLDNLFFLNYAGTGYGGVSGDQTNGRVNIWTGAVPGGNEKITISSNGNVGIGTTGSNYRMHVSSGAGETGMIMAVSTGATNVFSVDGYGVTALKFTGDGSGLTGLTAGAAATASDLAGGAQGEIPYQTGVSNTAMLAAGIAGELLQSGGAGAPSWTNAPTISGGNITGLPATSISAGELPASVIASSVSVASIHEAAFQSPKVNRTGDTMTGSLDIQSARLKVIADTSANQYSFAAGTGTVASHLYVSTSGNVGLGITNPDARLTLPYNGYIGWDANNDGLNYNAHRIGKSITGATPLEFRNDTNPGAAGRQFSFFYVGNELFTILNGGNVGIGQINPAAMLDVAGTGNFSGSVTTLSSGTFRAAGASQFSVETSSGILVQAGRIQAPAIQLTNGAAANYVLASDAAGNASWVNPAAGGVGDGWVGNEITDVAADGTLTRSGAGIAVDPYKVGLNLANNNNWTGIQAFTNGLSGSLTGAASQNVLKSGDTMTGALTLAGSTLTVTGDAFSVGGSTLVVANGKVAIGGTQTTPNNNVPLTLQGAGPFDLTWYKPTGAVGEKYLRWEYGGNYFVLEKMSDAYANISPRPEYWDLTNNRHGINLAGVPSYTLDVGGDINTSGALRTSGVQRLDASGNLANIGNIQLVTGSTLTSNGTFSISTAASAALTGVPALFIDQSGSVGIGTTTPGGKLHVYSPGQSRLYIDSPDNAAQLVLNSGVTGNFVGMTIQTGNTARWHVGENIGTVEIPNFTIYDQAASTSRFYINSTGNVGIGTTAPSYRLHVSSGAGEAGTVMAVSTGATNLFWVAGDGAHAVKYSGDGSGLTNLPVPGGLVSIAGDTMIGQLTNTSSVTITGNGGVYGLQVSSNVSLAGSLYSANGNVGIGTTTPTAKLDVRGSDASFITALYTKNDSLGGGVFQINNFAGALSNAIAGDALLTNTVGHLLISPNAVAKDIKLIGGTWVNPVSMIIKDGGNVGIGTTAPATQLNIRGADQTYYGNLYIEDSTALAADVGGKLGFGGIYTGVGAYTNFAAIKSGKDTAVTGEYGAYLSFLTRTNGQNDAVERMRLTSAGNVGIGTTNPVEKLDVAGVIRSTAAIYPGDGLAFQSGRGISDDAGTYRTVFSSNVYMVGYSSAAKYYGDGSGLTGVSATDATKLPIAGGTMSGQLTNTSSVTITGNGGGAYGLEVSSNVSLAGALYSANGNIGVGGAVPGAKLDIYSFNTTSFLEVHNASFGNKKSFRVFQSNNHGLLDVFDTAETIAIRLNADNTSPSYINAGNVGIGTTLPDQRLTVAGNISQTGVLISSGTGSNYFAGNVGIATTSPAGLFQVGGGSLTVLASGNVGIGTASPGTKLAVAQTICTTGDCYNGDLVIISSSVANYIAPLLGLYNVGSGPGAGAAIDLGGINKAQVRLATRDNSNYADDFIIMTIDSGNPANTNPLEERFRILADGNVGISTGAPQARLDVLAGGSAQTDMTQIWRNSAGTIVSSVSATGVLMANKFVGDGSGLSGVSASDNTKLPLSGGTLTGQLTVSASSLTVRSNAPLSPLLISTSPTPSVAGLYVDGSNNVGIGMTAPSRKLEVNGEITASRYEIGGSTVVAILPGIESLGIGVNAGRVNTGDYNVFVGSAAGYTNTTGGRNSFFGYRSGYNNTAGAYNSFFGTMAGTSNTTGINNTFLGAWAGVFNTTGEDNSFSGYQAGYGNTTGMKNSFFGSLAGLGNTTGGNNSFLGYLAGRYNSVGSANTIVGNGAGFGVLNNSFSSSTLMGYQAGYSLINGSADNIFLGFKAGYNVTTGTGNIVIGYDKDTSAPGASNELNIGGVIYGNLAAGYVGVGAGVTNPGGALQVGQNGLIISTGGAIQTTGLGNGVTVGGARGNGAVDLQTNRTVVGQVASGLNSVLGGGLANTSSGDYATVAGGQSNTATQYAATVSGGWQNAAGNNYASVSGGISNTASGFASSVSGGRANTASGDNSFVGGGGMDGIGGGGPNIAQGKWSAVVGGNNNIASQIGAAVVGGEYNVAKGMNSFIGGGGINVAAGWGSVAFGANSASMADYTFAAGKAATSAVNGTFTWADSSTEGAVNNVLDQVMFKAKGGFWVSTGTVYADPGLFVGANNNVGLGTTSPSVKFHNTGPAILANSKTIDPDSYGSSVIAGWINDVGYSASVAIGGMATNAGTTWAIGHDNAKLLFGAGDATNPNTLQTFMQVSANRDVALVPVSGNVGIGVAVPGAKLDVAGDIRISMVGKGLKVMEGSNARMGTVALTAGTAIVSNTSVTASTRIFLTAQSGGTPGALYVSARTAGTSFTITSTNVTDTSLVAWLLVEP